jgi:hypothetical protein
LVTYERMFSLDPSSELPQQVLLPFSEFKVKESHY